MADCAGCKIFGIGIFKTGLTSLGRALATLGYRFSADEWYHGKIVDDPWNLRPAVSDAYLTALKERADAYEAHVDYPWMFVFRQMRRIYPGARFIYTVRGPERLAASNRNYRRMKGTKEADLPSKEKIIRRYLEHQALVLEYFAGRDDLLIVDWAAGAGWEELCGFLSKPKPDCAFPWENKGVYEPAAPSSKSLL